MQQTSNRPAKLRSVKESIPEAGSGQALHSPCAFERNNAVATLEGAYRERMARLLLVSAHGS